MAKQPAILAIIAFSPDGLVISSIIQPGHDKEKISALSAMLLKDARRATSSFDFGEFKRILLVSEKGYLTVLNATEEIKIAMLCSDRTAFMKAFNELLKDFSKTSTFRLSMGYVLMVSENALLKHYFLIW